MQYRMPNINKVLISGHLTRDPEVKYTPAGQIVCRFGIASTRRFKPKDTDEWQERTAFITVNAWGVLAERISKTLKKGDAVYIEGELESRSWETPEGQKRSVVEIRAFKLQNLTRAEAVCLEGEEVTTDTKAEREEELQC